MEAAVVKSISDFFTATPLNCKLTKFAEVCGYKTFKLAFMNSAPDLKWQISQQLRKFDADLVLDIDIFKNADIVAADLNVCFKLRLFLVWLQYYLLDKLEYNGNIAALSRVFDFFFATANVQRHEQALSKWLVFNCVSCHSYQFMIDQERMIRPVFIYTLAQSI